MKNISFQKGSIGLVVLVIVLLMVILSGVAWYYMKSQNANLKSQNDNAKSKVGEVGETSVIPTEVEESLSDETETTITTTTDPTANSTSTDLSMEGWQSYTDNHFNVSFKYPPDVTPEEWRLGVVILDILKDSSLSFVADDLKTTGWTIYGNIPQKTISINDNIKFHRIIYQSEDTNNKFKYWYFAWIDNYPKKDNADQAIRFVSALIAEQTELNSKYLIFDQILSTFKFTQ